MSKIAQYYEDCERCYIQEDMTFEEIASRFELSDKTVRDWADKGKWRERKSAFVANRETLTEKMHAFVTRLMDTITADWDNGKQVDPGRLYALCQLSAKLEKVQKFEKVAAGDPTDNQAPADNEALVQRVREAMGLK